ncbi:uncharacterized protein LOC131320613 isoform X1 [Rhododendron vialii]|uniref:uncharacterized protein LOC131320613 isoform X1 n=1 Tax=Rhododendron vialii TaxID=182163 RepID=UPI00265DF98D|nr:uncharacterized protein LOC131320613 isoform X1 [Rhododendron vialii]XP_058207341.1 uncharacterized protein LOC131320613 isoform X1 [Rhododendron vialii]
MGAGRKKKTLTLKEKPQPSNTVNCSVSARNLRKSDLGSIIFGCKHNTIAECYSQLLFGLPGSHFAYVKNIRPGMPLFLFNYSDRKLHGIFEAVSAGQMNIDPYAWTGDGATSTPYPAQARVRIEKQCQPLKEDQYSPIIADNYYEPRLFWQELDRNQTKNLITLFSLSPVDVSTRHDIARHNTRPSKKQNKAECNTLVRALPKSKTSPFIADVERNTVVASSSTSHQPKTWSSLFKHSTSTETFKEDEDSKTQPSDSTLAHSNLYNMECKSSSMMPCLEGESQNFEALQEDSAMWNEERIRAGSESGEEVSSSSFQEGTIFEALVNDTKQEGEHGDTVVLCENLPRSDGSDMGWDSACATPHMSGEIQPSDAYMCADVTKDVAKVDEEEVSEHSYSSPDNHEEASDRVDSERGCSSEALAVADMESVVAKMIEEIVGLKDSQLKQVQKIGSLEKELVESKAEIQKLKNRCDLLESGLLPQIGHVQEAVIKTIDDTILLVGGFDGCSWLSALDSYSPSQDTMKSLKPMTFPRLYASAATLDGELYVFGGVDAGTWHDTVESYNPTNDQWVSRPSLNQKKGNLAGASLYGKIYAIGGGNGVECYAEVEMLDMNIGRWITTRSMLQKRFAPAAAEINGTLYVVGGYDGRNYLNSVERFDPREHSWTRVGSMSTRRGCHSVAVVNGKLYALGGYNGAEMVPTVEIFDPRLGSWMLGEPMNYARGYSGAAAIGEKICVIGGVNESDKILDTVECYNEGCVWEVTNLKAVGKRCYFSAIVL